MLLYCKKDLIKVNKIVKQKEFMKMYEEIHTSFIRYCKAKSYGILDYKDLVNETILRAFESFDKIKNKKSFPAYLFNISSNIIKNELRKKNRETNKSFIINQDLYVENKSIQKFEIELLYKALSKLPEEQKEAIILFEISGYSIKEITKIQDSSISAIKQRLKRGRDKLAIILNIPKIEKEKLNGKSKILISLFL